MFALSFSYPTLTGNNSDAKDTPAPMRSIVEALSRCKYTIKISFHQKKNNLFNLFIGHFPTYPILRIKLPTCSFFHNWRADFGNDKEHQHTLGESMYQPIPYKISSPLLLGLSKYLLLIGTESNIKAGVLCGTFLSLASLLYISFMAFTMSCTFVLML